MHFMLIFETISHQATGKMLCAVENAKLKCIFGYATCYFFSNIN